MSYGMSYSGSAYGGGSASHSQSGYFQAGYTGAAASYGQSQITHDGRGSYGTNRGTEPEQHAAFIADTFLNPNRPWTPIIHAKEEVMEIIEETFEKLTGTKFPKESISISVCTPKQLKSIHDQIDSRWSDGIMGFSFNRFSKGMSEVFVKQDQLDSLLLTLGHEIGHVMSTTLPNAQDEEAKAHAFSMAWIETIRENNIAGLKPNILPNPARNGLHDTAFDFVQTLIHAGSTAHEVFQTLSRGLMSIIAKQ